ncbi:MAG: 3-dehydroquinate synthase [Halanaerobiales bacterium]
MKYKVNVNLKELSYPIYIKKSLFDSIIEIINEKLPNLDKVCIVSDKNVYPLYGRKLKEILLNANMNVEKVVLKPGEKSKSYYSLKLIYNKLLENDFDRYSALISLGGGVVGDIAGYAAATYMRGMRLIQIPTTLLAQVDSSIGGKVAINHPKAKNLIGTFYQPELVIINIEFLNSLTQKEYISGMAEVIKHGYALNKDYFNFVKTNHEKILNLTPSKLIEMIYGSCLIKKNIVERDVRDRGERARLNFGHTIGHALESVTSYNILKHGEAVSLGMFLESKLACRLGFLKCEKLNSLFEVLQKYGLPTEVPDELDIDEIINIIKNDKKSKHNKVRFVLPVDIGKTVVTYDWKEKDLYNLFNDI